MLAHTASVNSLAWQFPTEMSLRSLWHFQVSVTKPTPSPVGKNMKQKRKQYNGHNPQKRKQANAPCYIFITVQVAICPVIALSSLN